MHNFHKNTTLVERQWSCLSSQNHHMYYDYLINSHGINNFYFTFCFNFWIFQMKFNFSRKRTQNDTHYITVNSFLCRWSIKQWAKKIPLASGVATVFVVAIWYTIIKFRIKCSRNFYFDTKHIGIAVCCAVDVRSTQKQIKKTGNKMCLNLVLILSHSVVWWQ